MEAAAQVFVSSTWLDLIPEREMVRDVTLQMRGLRFLGMEHFGARDADTRTVSLQAVEGCDLYVGILGGRWGSGITEAEYRKALALAKPTWWYIKRPEAIRCRDDEAQEQAWRAALEDEIRACHTCVEFSSPSELAARLSADLHNWLVDRILSRGLERLSVDYLTRIQGFVSEYLGSPGRPIPFGGRDAELQQLDTWLLDPKVPPYMLVAAGAGRGKSALLVRWTQSLVARADIVPLFVPVSIRFRTNLASVVFAVLTAYLGHLHSQQLHINPDTPAEVMRGRVADLLARPSPNGRRLVLIVDGLDEAADWDVGPDLFPAQVGRHVRVVVSARLLAGDADERDWLRRLGWDTPGMAATLALAGIDEEGVADVLTHMGFPLAGLAERDDIVRELHRLSEGDPLVVRLYVDDMLRRGEGIAGLHIEELRRIEPGLKGFFARWWDDQRRLWGRDNPLRERSVQLIMELLAGALGALSRDDLLALVPDDIGLNSWTLEDALEPLRRFIVGDGIEQGYVYSHPRLAIHFREGLTRADRDRLEKRFLIWCDTAVTQAEASLSEGHDPVLSPYVLQHLGGHLDRADAPMSRYWVFLNRSWREGRRMLEGSHSGFRGDLLRARRAVDRQAVRVGGYTLDADAMALFVRLGLNLVSLGEISRSTPPELVVPLVNHRLWGQQGALAYARAIPDGLLRARALMRLAILETGQARLVALREAFEIVRGLTLDKTLHETDEPLVLAELQILASCLPAMLRPLALSVALGLTASTLQRETVVELLRQAGRGELETVLAHVSSRDSATARHDWLVLLLTAFPGQMHGRALLRELPAWEYAWVLLEVSDRLEVSTRQAICYTVRELIDRVIERCQLEPPDVELLLAWAERVQPVPDDSQLAALPAIMARWPDSPVKARLMARWAVCCSAGEAAMAAHAAAREVRDRLLAIGGRIGKLTLCETVDFLTESEAAAALADLKARGLTAGDEGLLVRLVPRLPQVACDDALDLLTSDADIDIWLDALVPVLPRCSSRVCDALTEQLVRSPWVPTDSLIDRLSRLAPHLSARGVDAALSTVEHADATHVLARIIALADVLPSERRVAIYRSACSGITRDVPRPLLARWAAGCPAPVLNEWVDGLEDRGMLTALAEWLPAEGLGKALRKLQRIGDQWFAGSVVAAAALRVSPHEVLVRRPAAWCLLDARQCSELAIHWRANGALSAEWIDADPADWVAALVASIPADAAFAQAIVQWQQVDGLAGLSDTARERLLGRAAAIRDDHEAGQAGRAVEYLITAASEAFVRTRLAVVFEATRRFTRPTLALTVGLAETVPAPVYMQVFAAACDAMRSPATGAVSIGSRDLHLLWALWSLPDGLTDPARAALNAVLAQASNVSEWIAAVVRAQRVHPNESLLIQEADRLDRETDLAAWMRVAWALLPELPLAQRGHWVRKITDRLVQWAADGPRGMDSEDERGGHRWPPGLPYEVSGLARLPAPCVAVAIGAEKWFDIAECSELMQGIEREMSLLPLPDDRRIADEALLLQALRWVGLSCRDETVNRVFTDRIVMRIKDHDEQRLLGLEGFAPQLPSGLEWLIPHLNTYQIDKLCEYVQVVLAVRGFSAVNPVVLGAVLQCVDRSVASRFWAVVDAPQASCLTEVPLGLFVQFPEALYTLLSSNPLVVKKMLLGDVTATDGSQDAVISAWRYRTDGRASVAFLLASVCLVLRDAAEQATWAVMQDHAANQLRTGLTESARQDWFTPAGQIDWPGRYDARMTFPPTPSAAATPRDIRDLDQVQTRVEALKLLGYWVSGDITGAAPFDAQAAGQLIEAVVDVMETWP